jgi:hypothetical protein
MYEKFKHPSTVTVPARVEAEALAYVTELNNKLVAEKKSRLELEVADKVYARRLARLEAEHAQDMWPGLYAYLEGDAKLLETLIPEGAKWSKNEKGVQKTIREYVFPPRISRDGKKAIIRLAAIEAPTYRTNPVTIADLMDWERFLKPFGFTPADWMNVEEMQALVSSPAYHAPRLSKEPLETRR